MTISGGASKSNGESKKDPWAEQVPHLQKIFNGAEAQYNNSRPEFYGGQTFANPSYQTLSSINARTNAAGNSSMDQLVENNINSTASGAYQGQNTGANYAQSKLGDVYSNDGYKLLKDTAEGKNLNGNPYVNAMFDQQASKVSEHYTNTVNPQIDSSFQGSGRYGSGLHQRAKADSNSALASSLGDMAVDTYGSNYERERGMQDSAAKTIASGYNQNQSAISNLMSGAYESERDRQNNATGQAMDWKNQQYAAADQLAKAGADKEAISQQYIDENISRHDFEQNADTLALERYMRLIQGDYGGTTNTKQSGSQIGFQLPLMK